MKSTRRRDVNQDHMIAAVDLELKIRLKDGTKQTIAISQDTQGMQLDYYSNLELWCKPEELASFELAITRESWVDDQKPNSGGRREESPRCRGAPSSCCKLPHRLRSDLE